MLFIMRNLFLNFELLSMLMNGQLSVFDHEIEESELGMVAEDRLNIKKVRYGI